MMQFEELDAILKPKSVAVVGASGNTASWGYAYTHHLVDYGFKGPIYPINPNYKEILSYTTYPRLKDVPGTVDYVISCIPANDVLQMLEDASLKGVKGVHLYTARFSETGRQDAADLEKEVLKEAHKRKIRLIGPNCMGVYNPRAGLSFGYNLPKTGGKVGMASQTGGGASGFVHLGSLRGLRFSKVISYGNALDYNEADYLEYFVRDPETEIITMYIEGLRDGRAFFNTLKKATRIKPVIIVKGGRGEAGSRATTSHTASLAGSYRVWESAVRQAGAVPVDDIDELIDVTEGFYFLPPVKGTCAGILGGGGGPSVLAAWSAEEAGLDVIPLPESIRQEMKSKGITIWDWISNPIDVSIIAGSGLTDYELMEMMTKDEHFDLMIANMNEYVMITLATRERMFDGLRYSAANYIRLQKNSGKPFIAVLGDKGPCQNDLDNQILDLYGEIRTKLIQGGIPFYPSIGRAAKTARKIYDFYLRREPPC